MPILIRGKGDTPLDRPLELSKIGVELGVKALVAQKPPVALDQIELLRVGWQKEEFDSQVSGEGLHKGAPLVSGIVQDDVDGLRAIVLDNLEQELAYAFRIDVGFIG